jgi:hypothetical protein
MARGDGVGLTLQWDKNDIRRASLPAETRKLFLTAEMEEEVLKFSELMEVCHTVLFYLQKKMNGIRTSFDSLTKKYSLLRDDNKTNSRLKYQYIVLPKIL